MNERPLGGPAGTSIAPWREWLSDYDYANNISSEPYVKLVRKVDYRPRIHQPVRVFGRQG